MILDEAVIRDEVVILEVVADETLEVEELGINLSVVEAHFVRC